MALETIRFEDIAIEHIQSLIDNGVREGKSIEFKESLPGSADDDKREFLADVSSFANATGGILLYGLKEDRDAQGKATGLAAEVTGCRVENIDLEIRKLENILRDAIEPRITNIQTKATPTADGKMVFILHIPKSLQAPHAVTFKGMMRFYSRNSAGKYPLAVSEVRASFLHSNERIEEIRRFRINRVSDIVAGNTPIDLGDGPKTILHLIPLAPDAQLDLKFLAKETTNIGPLYNNGYSTKINFDGLVSHNQTLGTYAQFFRSGSIETTSAFIIRRGKEKLSIPSLTFEDEIIKTVRRYFSTFAASGVLPPIAIMLTLTNIRGFIMGVDSQRYWHIEEPLSIDRDDLYLPEILIEDFSEPASLLKPMFDAIWNAAGWPESHYYDKDGNWVGKKS